MAFFNNSGSERAAEGTQSVNFPHIEAISPEQVSYTISCVTMPERDNVELGVWRTDLQSPMETINGRYHKDYGDIAKFAEERQQDVKSRIENGETVNEIRNAYLREEQARRK